MLQETATERGIPRARRRHDDSRDLQPFRKASLLPFEHFPNLPRPKIPLLDLSVCGSFDVKAIVRERSIADQKKVGLSAGDEATQTEASHIVEIKQVADVIQTLLQDVGRLRKDLNFARSVLRAEYEKKLNHRATELYCRVNEKLRELEKQQKEKLEVVRASYRQQLVNAIQKIAGEYKAYYDELMSGKSGRHDLKIKELKEKLIEQERMMEVQALRMEELTAQLDELRDQENEEEPQTTPGISMEEAEELRETITSLEAQLSDTAAQLAAKEDSEKKLTHQLNSVKRELETERGKVAQLKRDMEGVKKKSMAEQEKAARLAESQRAALEKEMKEKADKAQKQALLEAQREAEERRLQDQATLELERERSRLREQQLMSQQSVAQPREREEGELEAELARLQLADTRQREEISRLKKELERVNKVWSTKLAIMQKNFHALRDESFLRSSLQRQAATLHHATLGYAVNSYREKGAFGDVTLTVPESTDSTMDSPFQTTEDLYTEQRLQSVPPPPSPSNR